MQRMAQMQPVRRINGFINGFINGSINRPTTNRSLASSPSPQTDPLFPFPRAHTRSLWLPFVLDFRASLDLGSSSPSPPHPQVRSGRADRISAERFALAPKKVSE